MMIWRRLLSAILLASLILNSASAEVSSMSRHGSASFFVCTTQALSGTALSFHESLLKKTLRIWLLRSAAVALATTMAVHAQTQTNPSHNELPALLYDYWDSLNTPEPNAQKIRKQRLISFLHVQNGEKALIDYVTSQPLDPSLFKTGRQIIHELLQESIDSRMDARMLDIDDLWEVQKYAALRLGIPKVSYTAEEIAISALGKKLQTRLLTRAIPGTTAHRYDPGIRAASIMALLQLYETAMDDSHRVRALRILLITFMQSPDNDSAKIFSRIKTLTNDDRTTIQFLLNELTHGYAQGDPKRIRAVRTAFRIELPQGPMVLEHWEQSSAGKAALRAYGHYQWQLTFVTVFYALFFLFLNRLSLIWEFPKERDRGQFYSKVKQTRISKILRRINFLKLSVYGAVILNAVSFSAVSSWETLAMILIVSIASLKFVDRVLLSLQKKKNPGTSRYFGTFIILLGMFMSSTSPSNSHRLSLAA
jgi:hypothetical protein